MVLKLFLNTRMIWMICIKKIKECNPNKKHKILIVFDDMNTDMLSNEKRNYLSQVTELFI